jgi:hypothetical protein
LDRLKGVGERKRERLEKAGIFKLKDLCGLDDDSLKKIQESSRISVKFLKTYQEEAENATDGKSSFPKNFDWVMGNSNPYETRYGSKWRTEIKKVSRSGLTRFKCVTDLVEHIDQETAKCFAGTPYAKNYYWSHNALNQMCDKRCTAWMIEEGYYDRWIKPELGCNDVVITTTDSGEKNSIITTKSAQ